MDLHKIFTDRLILIKITPAVIHHLFDNKNKAGIIDFFGVDETGFEKFREMHERGMETHKISLCFFLLVDKQTGLPIGECGFHTLNSSHNRAELFYLLRNESDKQKGFMSEALARVLEYGFTELNLHRVEALVASSNIPSIKLLKKFGFSFEGTMREDYVVNGKNEDSDCYSLLKWEWTH